MHLPHPQTFHSDLTSERLEIIASSLLDVRFRTIRELDSPLDDHYVRESAVFGRSRNKLIQLYKSKEHDWLGLTSPGMDVTICIGSVPCRFFRDDHENPKKPGFFKRDYVNDLFGVDDSLPVVWLFIVERALTEEDEDRVFFIGYNAFREKVSEWKYGSSAPILHSVGRDTPLPTDIPPAPVGVPEEDAGYNAEAQNE